MLGLTVSAYTMRRLFCLGLLLAGLCLWPLDVPAEKGGVVPVCHLPVQEEQHAYTLDFLFFKNLAEGSLQLTATDQPNVLRAELVGRTRGIAAWLTGDRVQRYISFMEKMADGSLRSLSHESEILKRSFDRLVRRSKHYRFDYERRTVFLEKGKDGIFHPAQQFDLPTGQSPVDILTGFYNLRAGCYGELTPGRHIEIPTFTSKGFSMIDIEVHASAQRPHPDFFPARGALLQVTVDPDVFETSDGGMFIWFDEQGQPARGIVENVIDMGDVRGHLKEDGKP